MKTFKDILIDIITDAQTLDLDVDAAIQAGDTREQSEIRRERIEELANTYMDIILETMFR